MSGIKELDLFQVDAFAERVFEGNPAAVVPLQQWLADDLLLKIAEENNLSETAFIVPQGEGFQLRWFTPAAEVDLCGHATLAAAHVVFEHLGYAHKQVSFESRSGELIVHRTEQGLMMDFPATLPESVAVPEAISQVLNVEPQAVLLGFDHIVVLADEQQVLDLSPDLSVLQRLDSRGVVFTAPGSNYDCVSRCFFPKLNVPEDPVTGSAHCQLAPFWAQRLNKNHILARQASRRGGTLQCVVVGDRVQIHGTAVDYLKGTIKL